MRLFIGALEPPLYDAIKAACFLGEPASVLLDALAVVQARLPPQGGFAVGPEFSLADVAIAPFLLRIIMVFEHELGKFPLGEGRKALEALKEPRFARLTEYLENIRARSSIQKTWDEVSGMCQRYVVEVTSD